MPSAKLRSGSPSVGWAHVLALRTACAPRSLTMPAVWWFSGVHVIGHTSIAHVRPAYLWGWGWTAVTSLL